MEYLGGADLSLRGCLQDHHPICRLSLSLNREGGVEELGGVDLS